MAAANSSQHYESDMQTAVDALYPAVLQTFVCILLGYGAGRVGLISSVQATGLGTYVSVFALPALLFQNMASLDWSKVDWTFMASMALSKLTVFTLVFVLTLLVTRPVNFATAGIYAIFVSQSNDFALGYPIVKAMYENSRPEFLQYIYLIAPLSLCILNPIAFGFIELQKQRDLRGQVAPPIVVDSTTYSSCCLATRARVLASVLKNVLLNPIVLFTAIGLLGNLAFHHKLPIAIEKFVDVLGQSFSATALFYLGLSIVGKLGADLNRSLITCSLLIAVKLVVFPFLSLEFTRLLNCGYGTNSTADYTMFGYLFGTFPTAPSVFVYATQYGVLPDLIATGMVLCTVVSAPLMFISAIMMSMRFFSLDYLSILNDASFDVAILSVLCVTWVLAVFLVTRRLHRMPHLLCACLCTCQLLAAAGVLVSHTGEPSNLNAQLRDWRGYVQFCIHGYGLLGSYVFTAIISVALTLLRFRGLCYLLKVKIYLILVGYGTPLLVIGLMLLLASSSPLDEKNARAFLGTVQHTTHLVVMSMSIAVTVVALVLRRRLAEDQQTAAGARNGIAPLRPSINDNSVIPLPAERRKLRDIEDMMEWPAATLAAIKDVEEGAANSKEDEYEPTPGAAFGWRSEGQEADDDEEERMCLLKPPSSGCSSDERSECRRILQRYSNATAVEDTPSGGLADDCGDPQVTRHMVLVIILLLVMMSSIYVCICQLANDDLVTTGVFIELVFMDTVLNIGQGFFSFVVFGLDSQLVLVPIWRKLTTILRSIGDSPEEGHVSSSPQEAPTSGDDGSCSDVARQIRKVAELFLAHHLRDCKRQLLHNIRIRCRTYKQCFKGTELVAWLVTRGLAKDHLDAVFYAQCLVHRKIIEHVATKDLPFYNLPYVYQFSHDIPVCDEMPANPVRNYNSFGSTNHEHIVS